MIVITLEQLNAAAKQLPHPQTLADMRVFTYRVPIPLPIRVLPLATEPTTSPVMKVATFELRKYGEHGGLFWRWSPLDEIAI